MRPFQVLFLAVMSGGAAANVPVSELDISALLESHQCGNSTWTDLLDDCLDCALEYDIWNDYRDGVTQVAGACDLPAVPEQPDADESVPPSTTPTVSPDATGTVSTAVSATTASTSSHVDAVASTTSGIPSPSRLIDNFAVVKGQVDTLITGMHKGRSVDDEIEYHLQDFLESDSFRDAVRKTTNAVDIHHIAKMVLTDLKDEISALVSVRKLTGRPGHVSSPIFGPGFSRTSWNLFAHTVFRDSKAKEKARRRTTATDWSKTS
ncbi:hypothetical protein DL768_009954 [Monosporascus sp. mg162]|nr:hypothetical protein DL768_009954 [Monosporascus sp. mg162]